MPNFNFRVDLGVEKIAIDNPNKRYMLFYYQHNPDDYQNYSIDTDGTFTMEDNPVEGTAMAAEGVPRFIHQYRNGSLFVHVTNATWVKIIYHIARPGMEPYQREYLLVKTPPTATTPPATLGRSS